jgi:hypothetical protein
MHQKMTELRPRMCEIGAKKNGPAAIPANAAEFWVVLGASGMRVIVAYRVGLLQLGLVVQLLLIREVELSRQRRNRAGEGSKA